MYRLFSTLLLGLLLFSLTGTDEITGTVGNGNFLDFVVLSPKVCGENVFTVLTCFWPPCDFTLSPPSGCSFCDTFDYWVTVVDDDGDTIQEPGEPIALYGPFNVDPLTCSYAIPETLEEITSGGFEGTIYNATKTIPIDSLMINIYHHYIGSSADTYMLETTLAPMNLTPIGGGNYTYQMTGISSGAKHIEFFSDGNGNGILDPGELATLIERDVPVVGNQYDDSVDIDMTALSVNKEVHKPDDRIIKAVPNPFNSTVMLFISRVIYGDRLFIKDISGRLVREFNVAPSIIWDGTDRNGAVVPCGIYFATLERNREARVRIWFIK